MMINSSKSISSNKLIIPSLLVKLILLTIILLIDFLKTEGEN